MMHYAVTSGIFHSPAFKKNKCCHVYEKEVIMDQSPQEISIGILFFRDYV
jgi:hypothetical protein